MIFRPDRGHGVTVGIIAAGWPLALGIGMLVRAAAADVTFGAFLLYAVGFLLLFLALAFGYWTYACASMAYIVDEATLRIRWGLHETVLPLARIDVVTQGLPPPNIRGLNWPGQHVGRSVLQDTAEATVFATEFRAESAVYLRSGEAILAITPADAPGFIATVEARRRGAPAYTAPSRSDAFEPRSFLRDRAVRASMALAALAVLVSFGVLFARYQDLADTLRVNFPSGSDVTHVIERGDLFAIPLTALAVVAVDVVLVIVLHRHQRALAQTMMGGATFIAMTLAVATALAVA